MNNTLNIMNSYKTYSWDIQILEELGLNPFEGINGEEVFVGKVEGEAGHVSIWVTGYPAQFFRFDIYSEDENKTYKVTTGSGSLTEYWPMVDSMWKGLFAVESITEGELK